MWVAVAFWENSYIFADEILLLIALSPIIGMFMWYFLLCFYSIMFGITQKIADAVDEHNVKLFKYDNFLFGVLFAIFGCLVINIDKSLVVYFIAIVIYWLIKNKLDYINHQITASIILMYIIFFFDIKQEFLPCLMTIFCLLAFSSTLFKSHIFFIYKYRFYIVSLVVSAFYLSAYVFVHVFFTLLFIEYTKKYLTKNFKYKE